MPDNSTNSVPDLNSSGTFSFQAQGDTSGQAATPTAPFETISYQTPTAPKDTTDQQTPTPPITNQNNTKLDQTDLSILKESQEKELSKLPQGESFLNRYKTQEVEPEKPSSNLNENYAPSSLQTKLEKNEPQPKPTSDNSSYKMPDLPKGSFFGKLLPIALFLLVIGLAIFVGMKFLPGLTGAKKIDLVWWGLWEDEKIVQPVLDEYKKIKPNVTIQYVKKNHKEYRTLLQSSIARGSGPDIFRFHNTWVPMLKVELGPMPEKLKSGFNFSSDYYPTAYYDLVINNQIYGLPLMFDGLALYYNTDIFAQAGQKAPDGWSEVADTARKLTVFDEKDNLKIAGLALGNTSVDHWSDILGAMMFQNGGNPALPTDSCAKEAIDYFASFSSGKTRVWDDTLGRSTLAFASGKVAMYIAPSWEVFELKKINPNLNFSIVPFPQVAGGKRYWASYWVEGVNSSSKNVDASWDFLLFLSKKESLQLLYSESTKSSKERLFGEIYPRTDMAPLLQKDPLIGPYLIGAKQAKSWYLSSFTHDDGINDRMIKYYEDAVNSVVKKEKTSDEALKTAAIGIAQVLKDYGLAPPTSNNDCQTETSDNQ